LSDCIFCDIVTHEIECFSIWEDEKHLAFLSIYPNTEGVTVVIPKLHYPSYLFSLDDTVIIELILASKKVAQILDNAFGDVARTGMIFEGFGVNHVHSKLIPMHGTSKFSTWVPIQSKNESYFHRYEGYISSHDCHIIDRNELAIVASMIRESCKQ